MLLSTWRKFVSKTGFTEALFINHNFIPLRTNLQS